MTICSRHTLDFRVLDQEGALDVLLSWRQPASRHRDVEHRGRDAAVTASV